MEEAEERLKVNCTALFRGFKPVRGPGLRANPE